MVPPLPGLAHPAQLIAHSQVSCSPTHLMPHARPAQGGPAANAGISAPAAPIDLTLPEDQQMLDCQSSGSEEEAGSSATPSRTRGVRKAALKSPVAVAVKKERAPPASPK